MARHSAAFTFVTILAVAGGALLPSGCLSVDSLLNPTFVQSLTSGGGGVANLPGEAPAIVLEVHNETGRNAEFRVTWRDSEGQIQERARALGVDESFAEMLICPIDELTLGDVSDLTATGAIVRLGSGSAIDPFIEVEAFGVLLQDGINYDCGDSVSFRILPSGATLSGYQIFAFINRSGAQTGSENTTENP